MATQASAGRPARHRDRNFYLGFAIFGWLGVLLGFVPPLAHRWAGGADYPAPLVLQIHALSFTAWMALLVAQIVLVRADRRDLHRSLGIAMAGLIPVMVLTGFFAEVYSQRFHLTHPPDSQAFFILPIFYAAAFGMLAAAAVVRRKTAAAHKRLIYLATAVIVGAGWTRTTGAPLAALVGDGFLGLVINSFTPLMLMLIALAWHDLTTNGRLHRVTRVGGSALVVCVFAVSWIYHAPGWLPIARAIVTPLPGPPI